MNLFDDFIMGVSIVAYVLLAFLVFSIVGCASNPVNERVAILEHKIVSLEETDTKMKNVIGQIILHLNKKSNNTGSW